MMGTEMIEWPAILHYSGTAELDYVDSQAAWDKERCLNAFNYQDADRLIDASGRVFLLSSKLNGSVVPVSSADMITLDELLDLVRNHGAQLGKCCVPKISAASIAEAIRLVKPD